MFNTNALVVVSLVSVVTISSGFVSAQNHNESESARKFNNISDINNCGQIYTKKQFLLESPLYPSNYPLNYQCSYLIKGPTCATNFNLQFLDFNLQDSLGCTKDRLEIEDQDALCGIKTGNKSYFSEKGSLVLKLVSDKTISARGFRILITRSSCVSKKEQTTKQPDWYTTNIDAEYTPKTSTTTITPRVNYNPSLPKNSRCCSRIYNSKEFTLTSPNFPYSFNRVSSCYYEIHKTNSGVCRLRINAKFFYLGPPSQNCPEGYLEIDGRYFCGCATDLKLVTPFADETKIIKLVSTGLIRNSYSGFVLNVIQDECPKKLIPEEANENSTTSPQTFKYYNDQINRVAWPSNNFSNDKAVVERLKLISENTEIIPEDSNRLVGASRVIKHVYFFAGPDFNYDSNNRDREETTYVDTTSMVNTIFRDSHDYGVCLNWNRRQLLDLPSVLETCKDAKEGSEVSRDCVDLSYIRGYFKSPGYPFYYPGNLNICYRFKKLPGYCSIKVYMRDFQIENSVNCKKDYLTFGISGKYCGARLSNTILTLDLSGKPYEDANFVTDASYCGRGFSGTYEQIACQDMTFPITPINPTRPPVAPSAPCGETVQRRMFALEVFDYSGPTCRFTIKKSSEFVCKVELYFEKFDLVCASESLVVDGTMYCGRLTGQTITINVQDREPVIVYRKLSNEGVVGPRFRITGVQSEDCYYPEVPAERLYAPQANQLNSTPESQEDARYLIKLFNENFKDVCGVVTNNTEVSLPETFCNFLMKNDSITQCVPLKENSIVVPLGSQKIQLKIKDVDKIEEVEFREINCDEIS